MSRQLADHRCSVKEGRQVRLGAPELELVWTTQVLLFASKPVIYVGSSLSYIIAYHNILHISMIDVAGITFRSHSLSSSCPWRVRKRAR